MSSISSSRRSATAHRAEHEPAADAPLVAGKAAFSAGHLSAGEDAATIGDVAREFGVTLRALRFYEDRGLIAPQREGTARYYDGKQKARLALILKGKRLGFTLSEIRAMLAAHEAGGAGEAGGLPLTPAQVREQIGMLERQQAEIAQAIAELRARLEAQSASG